MSHAAPHPPQRSSKHAGNGNPPTVISNIQDQPHLRRPHKVQCRLVACRSVPYNSREDPRCSDPASIADFTPATSVTASSSFQSDHQRNQDYSCKATHVMQLPGSPRKNGTKDSSHRCVPLASDHVVAAASVGDRAGVLLSLAEHQRSLSRQTHPRERHAPDRCLQNSCLPIASQDSDDRSVVPTPIATWLSIPELLWERYDEQHPSILDYLLSHQYSDYWEGIPPWTPQEHYGLCGQSCPCCRSHNQEDGWFDVNCQECFTGIMLIQVSATMRRLLRSYVRSHHRTVDAHAVHSASLSATSDHTHTTHTARRPSAEALCA